MWAKLWHWYCKRQAYTNLCKRQIYAQILSNGGVVKLHSNDWSVIMNCNISWQVYQIKLRLLWVSLLEVVCPCAEFFAKCLPFIELSCVTWAMRQTFERVLLCMLPHMRRFEDASYLNLATPSQEHLHQISAQSLWKEHICVYQIKASLACIWRFVILDHRFYEPFIIVSDDQYCNQYYCSCYGQTTCWLEEQDHLWHQPKM